MKPIHRARLLKLILVSLGACVLTVTVWNSDKIPPSEGRKRAVRFQATHRSAGQSFSETSRTQRAPLDWKHLCQIADEESGRNWSEWNARQAGHARGLRNLTIDELLDLLSKIPSLACSESATVAITNIILGAIIEKQPVIGFSLALDRFKENPLRGREMAARFREWITKDYQTAETWLQAQDWGGLAEIPHSPLIDMGSAILTRHLNHNLDQVGILIPRLPMQSRFEIIKYGFTNCDRTVDDIRAATFIRQSLNPHEVPRMFGEVYSHLGLLGNYQKIDNLLQTISASDEEKNAIVLAASKARMIMGTGKPDGESLDEIRSWARTQAPGVLDRVSGELISIMYDRDHNEKLAEVRILKLHDAGASDDVINAFIDSSESKKSPETIQRLKDHLRAGSEFGQE